MAREILNTSPPPQHTRHDLESLFWVILSVCLAGWLKELVPSAENRTKMVQADHILESLNSSKRRIVLGVKSHVLLDPSEITFDGHFENVEGFLRDFAAACRGSVNHNPLTFDNVEDLLQTALDPSPFKPLLSETNFPKASS